MSVSRYKDLNGIKKEDIIVKVDIKSGKILIDNIKETWEKMGVISLSSNIVYFPRNNDHPKATKILTADCSAADAKNNIKQA